MSRAQGVAENVDNEKGGHTFSRPAEKAKVSLPKEAYAFAPRKVLQILLVRWLECHISLAWRAGKKPGF